MSVKGLYHAGLPGSYIKINRTSIKNAGTWCLYMNLLILGAGGHGRVCREVAESMATFDKIDFLDDKAEGTINSGRIIGKFADYEKFLSDYPAIFIGIGNNKVRLELIEKLQSAGFKLVNLISPTAYVSPSSLIEAGAIIEPHAVVNTGAKVGSGSIVSIGALIDHDCVIGLSCHVSPGVIVKNSCTVPDCLTIPARTVFTGVEP